MADSISASLSLVSLASGLAKQCTPGLRRPHNSCEEQKAEEKNAPFKWDDGLELWLHDINFTVDPGSKNRDIPLGNAHRCVQTTVLFGTPSVFLSSTNVWGIPTTRRRGICYVTSRTKRVTRHVPLSDPTTVSFLYKVATGTGCTLALNPPVSVPPFKSQRCTGTVFSTIESVQ